MFYALLTPFLEDLRLQPRIEHSHIHLSHVVGIRIYLLAAPIPTTVRAFHFLLRFCRVRGLVLDLLKFSVITEMRCCARPRNDRCCDASDPLCLNPVVRFRISPSEPNHFPRRPRGNKATPIGT